MRRRRIVGMGVQPTGPGRRGMACSRLAQSTYSGKTKVTKRVGFLWWGERARGN